MYFLLFPVINFLIQFVSVFSPELFVSNYSSLSNVDKANLNYIIVLKCEVTYATYCASRFTPVTTIE